MDQTTPHEYTTEQIHSLDAAERAAVASLLAQLSPKFSDYTFDEIHLLQLLSSPSHALLAIRANDGTIVGIASLSLLLAIEGTKKVWLDDFVVDSAIRGHGLGSQLWQAVVTWAADHGAQKLIFTSHSSRTAAQQFYQKHGATTPPTNFLEVNL